MNKSLKIGVCRTSPMGLIPEIYKEKDYTVEYIKGFLEMFVNDHEIFIATPINEDEEKIFNNQKIHTKYPFIKKINYNPYETREDLDIIVIFSKEENETTYYIDGISYEKYIENIIKINKEAKVYYVQYNEVNFDFSENFDLEKNKFNILMNSSKCEDILLNRKYYGGLNVHGISLDLTELIFRQRISAKDNFYNKVGLFNNSSTDLYEELKTPNSMKEYIYSFNKYNKDEDTDYIKNDYTDKYNIFVEKLQLCNFVFIDKSKNEDFYNSDFIIISNNSYPIIIDQDNHDLHIKIEDLNFFNEEDIESFYSQKYLKQLRIDMKKYYLKYDLKTRLLNIFNSGK